MKKIFVIDNYDSFTYNLVQYLEELNCKVSVKRNDQFNLKELEPYDYIVLSPGPGIPDESGLLKDAINLYAPTKNILGVCLGLQAIGEVFGGSLINLDKVYHGVSSKISIIKEDLLFKGLSKTLEVGRYHSWILANPAPEDLEVTSIDENGYIMSLRHKKYKVRAVQYHPESILTPDGKKILENWINS
tara:strand:+ start:637 stop:1200 length:564 start_codon:yes stop_codon:yes gene_type:complete